MATKTRSKTKQNAMATLNEATEIFTTMPISKINVAQESKKKVITKTRFIDAILYQPDIELLNQEKRKLNAKFDEYMKIIPQMQIALSNPVLEIGNPPFISEVIDSNPMCSSILTNLQSYFNLSMDVTPHNEPPVPPQFPNHPDPRPVYDNYLNNFNGHDIFTLKSDRFQPDQLCDIGRWNDPKELNRDFKKYYEPNDFDTKCLLVAILYRILLQGNFSAEVIYETVSSYTDDPDPDDLYDIAEDDIFRVFTVYGIVKRITAFIETGQIDKSMKYLTALKEWIKDEESRANDPEISQNLLKRIGTMVELLWYILYTWPVKIPDPTQRPQEQKKGRKKQTVIEENNVKLYAGIGTSSKDANYDVFVQRLFDDHVADIRLPLDMQTTIGREPEDPAAEILINEDAVPQPVESHKPIYECFHDRDSPPLPQRPGQQIISRDFVSTAYSFDAAAKFCKGLGCGNLCMLEFILPPGATLPFVGSSANEAEVLLKPGNVYQFIKRYKVQYTRLNRRGDDETVIIFVYQFLLINQNNTILPRKMPTSVRFTSSQDRLDLSKHKDWSETINLFIKVFGKIAGLQSSLLSKRQLTLPSSKAGSKAKSKSHRKSNRKTKRKRTQSKRRRTKRRNNKRRTNKRRRI